MSEGGVYPEEPNLVPDQPKRGIRAALNKVAGLLRSKTKPSENMSVEQRPYFLESDFTIPTGSGYDVLSTSSEDTIARNLRNLYPDFMSMLRSSENSYSNDLDGMPTFNMQITESWQVGIKESDRIRLVEELQKGNKKVIAVMAYYLADKCRDGNLQIVEKPFFTEKPRDARLRVGNSANKIMIVMEKLLAETGSKFFAANERANWQNILAPEDALNSDLGVALQQAQQIVSPRN